MIVLKLKHSLVLSAGLIALSAGAGAATIQATCTQGLLSTYLGVSCTIGDKIFDSFTYTGNVPASSVSIDFQNVGTEYRLILAPTTGAGFFTSLTFTNSISVQPGVAPNIPPAVYMVTTVKDQANFSLSSGSTGTLHIVHSPGPTFNLQPGAETGGPIVITPTVAVLTTTSLTGANPGLSSFELGYIQTNIAIPEPDTLALLGGALIVLGLVSRRVSGCSRE